MDGRRASSMVKCLAEETGALYITAESRQNLIKAFDKAVGCPTMSAVDGSLRAPLL